MEIRQVLREFIISTAPDEILEGIDDDYDLLDSGVMDSLLLMSVVTYLEEQHQVEFGVNDILPEHFRSINALSEFMNNRLTSNS